MNALSLLGRAFRSQLVESVRSPGDSLALVATPLFTAMIWAVLAHAGRPDLAAVAIVAPTVMAMWTMALLVSGEIIDRERTHGTFELLVQAPAPLVVVVLGRVSAVTAVSLLAFAESLATAHLLGARVVVHHPALLVVTLLVTAFGTAAWATAMSGLFVFARSARTFQNTLSYPVYLLGGALVPADQLPDVLQPLARVVYLSWTSDLLRQALAPATPAAPVLRVAIAAGLGVAGLLVGWRLIGALVERMRASGAVSRA